MDKQRLVGLRLNASEYKELEIAAGFAQWSIAFAAKMFLMYGLETVAKEFEKKYPPLRIVDTSKLRSTDAKYRRVLRKRKKNKR